MRYMDLEGHTNKFYGCRLKYIYEYFYEKFIYQIFITKKRTITTQADYKPWKNFSFLHFLSLKMRSNYSEDCVDIVRG